MLRITTIKIATTTAAFITMPTRFHYSTTCRYKPMRNTIFRGNDDKTCA